jgi:hypothetical protein
MAMANFKQIRVRFWNSLESQSSMIGNLVWECRTHQWVTKDVATKFSIFGCHEANAEYVASFNCTGSKHDVYHLVLDDLVFRFLNFGSLLQFRVLLAESLETVSQNLTIQISDKCSRQWRKSCLLFTHVFVVLTTHILPIFLIKWNMRYLLYRCLLWFIFQIEFGPVGQFCRTLKARWHSLKGSFSFYCRGNGAGSNVLLAVALCLCNSSTATN